MVLLKAENEELRIANERQSKRRRVKRTRLQDGGSLSIQEAEDLIAGKEVDEQLQKDIRESGRRTMGAEPRARRCGSCGKTGHNARTCQVAWETSDEGESE